jgi:hypothetical protein
VNGDEALVDPSGVPNMVETMALIDDTVGFTFVETSKSQVRDGVTISDVCVGLALSVVKDTKEAMVELRPSIDSGGAAIPKVGLFRSKYEKGGGDGLGFFEEGKDMGVW